VHGRSVRIPWRRPVGDPDEADVLGLHPDVVMASAGSSVHVGADVQDQMAVLVDLGH
jgi:hypothetical protein